VFPFIKAGALGTVLSAVGEGISVRIVTRWLAAEIAAGVTDLEVFELVQERANTELALLDDLHAKLYLADDGGLAGSANLTAAALGWSERSNVELLLPVQRGDPDVVRLLRRLEAARPATFAVRSAIEAEAAALEVPVLDEGQEAAALEVPVLDEGQEAAADAAELRKYAWLPSCAAPGKLRAIYESPKTTAVVEGTRTDGLADLSDLHLPRGLSALEFNEAVRDTLLLMPAFKRIIDRIPQGLTDSGGVALVGEFRPDLLKADAAVQWRIVRDWIAEFFQDQFEVAPESFITRLRPR
jgi:hypothetical protein